MNKLERLLAVAGAALNELSEQLIEDLFRFDWLGLIRALLTTDDEVLLLKANELLVILQAFTARIGILPVRVAAFMAAESLDLPKKLSQRVVRCDKALSFTLKEVMDTGFELAAGRFVPIYDVFKTFNRWFLTFRLFTALDSVAFLRLAKGSIIAILVAIARVVWAVFVSIATAVLVLTLLHKWREASHEKTILSNVLPQDSKRVTRWVRHRQTFRVNLKEGPDT